MQRQQAYWLGGVLGGFMTMPGSAFAQAASAEQANPGSSGELMEIVVTAQKRSERLQDVPLTVSALSAENLQNAGVTNVQDLGLLVPGLVISNDLGSAITHLRGIGSSAHAPGIENPIALYVDGIYYASANSSLFDFLNVENVEVLKGPQGTLFGRNATGGLIQITTNEPTQATHLDADVGYGNFQTVKGGVYLAGGIAENLAADIALQGSRAGEGYGRNVATGQEIYRNEGNVSVRSKWVWTPLDNTKISMILDYSQQRNTDNPTSLVPGASNLPAAKNLPTSFGSPWNVSNDTQPLFDNKNGGASLRISHEFDFATLTDIVAYRRAKSEIDFDLDATALPIQAACLHTSENQVSEELQLSSNQGSNLRWTTGLYYFHSDGQYDPSHIEFGQLNFYPAPSQVYPLASLDEYGNQTANSYAGYGQATATVLPKTNLTLGVRYTYETHSMSGDQPEYRPNGTLIPGTDVLFPLVSKSFDKTTFRAALDHHLTDDALLYASVSTGFKSGGYNTQVYSDGAYQPETLTAYEVGAKTEFFDHKLRIDLSGFHDDYKNIQVQKIEGSAVGIINGASARTSGFDLDVTGVVNSALKFNGSAEYLDATFNSFPNAPLSNPDIAITTHVLTGSAAGNELPYSSHWVFTTAGNYSINLPTSLLSVNVTVNRVGAYFAEADNVIKQPAYTKLNASLDWQPSGGRYGVSLWGRNLTNAAVFGYAATLASGLHFESLAPPRTYGVDFHYHF
jgi:iron complex outermembrane receptor protein